MRKIVLFCIIGAVIIITPVISPTIIPDMIYNKVIYVPLYGELLGYRLKMMGQSELSECFSMPASLDRDKKYEIAKIKLYRSKIAYLVQLKMFPNNERLENNLVDVQKMTYTIGKRQTL